MALREIVLALSMATMVGCVSDGPKVLPRKGFKEEYKPKRKEVPICWYYWANKDNCLKYIE